MCRDICRGSHTPAATTAQATRPTNKVMRPKLLNCLWCITARTIAPTAPIAPASVGVVRPSIIVPSTTKNSPTNPLVAGSPEFAMAKSTKKAAKTGMVLATPP